MGGNSEVPLIVNGKRLDGRGLEDLRPITIEAGVLNRANGSAYLTWGKNKVLAAVYGPREVFPKHETNLYGSIVRCRYMMAPFSTEEHGRAGPNRRSREISKVMKEAFESVVIKEVYPKTAIDIYVDILEGQGSTRVAGLTAAAVALANAGIPMKDIPIGVSVGKIDNKIAVDMMKEEDNFGQADMPLAINPTTGEVILLQMDGKMTRDEFIHALELAFAKVPEIREKQIEALREFFKKSSASIDEGNGNGSSEIEGEQNPIVREEAVGQEQ
ncbi:MAG: exosome complex exonuclease Rrp41 [Candidatus Micrarchaeia archaeon]